MYSYPSRSEKRQVQLLSAAEKGMFSFENIIIYPREITKLEKDGFTVRSIKPYKESKALFTATVEWSNAYGCAIPHIVYSYIHGIIETSPQKAISTFAQELYVIAHKANAKK